MKKIPNQYGYQDKPIWVTETSTFSGRMGGLFQSEEEQAADLVKRFAILKAAGVKRVFWCGIEEIDYEGGTDEGFFDQSGLVYDGRGVLDRGKGVKKKSYFAYKEIVKRLSHSSFIRMQNDSLTYLLMFSTPSGKVSVIWQDKWNGNKKIRVIGKGKVEVYSIYGEKLSSFLDAMDLQLGIEPVYLVGDVEKFEYEPGVLFPPT